MTIKRQYLEMKAKEKSHSSLTEQIMVKPTFSEDTDAILTSVEKGFDICLDVGKALTSIGTFIGELTNIGISMFTTGKEIAFTFNEVKNKQKAKKDSKDLEDSLSNSTSLVI